MGLRAVLSMNQQSLLDAESSLVDRAFRCDTCGENPHRIVDSIGDPEPNREISMKITKVTPWLLLATAAYNFGRQGEYIFVEVQTDEGITDWGEVTTTHPVANRAVCAVLQQMDPLLASENPFHIEKLWNKMFRTFTYMGSRGAATNAISGIDIALRDIRGKAMNQPIFELLGGPVRESIALYTHPDPNIGPDEAKRQAKEIADSGH